MKSDQAEPAKVGKTCLASISLGTWIRLAILILFITAIVVLIVLFPTQVKTIFLDALNWIQARAFWGAVVFVGIYVLATVLFLPASILTLGAGFIFKFWGIIPVWIGATIGLTIAFLLGRTILRSWVEKSVEKYPKFKAVDAAIAEKGWIIVLLVRLSPVIPFNLLNYGLALTSVKFWQYFLASAGGIIPGTALYIYIGSLAGDLSEIAAGNVGPNLTTKIIIWVVSGVIIVVTVVVISIIAKRAITKAVEKNVQSDNEKNKAKPFLNE
eukprot:TRINITY_DN7028_c0_g1_i1.p1 TRINITY_DN7028_c0_g1~~TRINITY_DN7028_c0_g1_i1.p1  ORF type:complete len:269 (-),score=29.11 TRINITY_DN7028_c0_g1_i1:53-859(-)